MDWFTNQILVYVPVYSSILVIVYTTLYLTLDDAQIDNIMMVADVNRNESHQVWRWYTYSFAHGTTLHIVINVLGMSVYGFITEMLNSALFNNEKEELRKLVVAHLLPVRCVVIHAWSIIGGAFALGWQARATGGHYALIGASGGNYGLMGALGGYMHLHWKNLSVLEKVLYAIVIVSTAVAETIVYLTLHSSNISFVCHIGGALTGFLVGTAVYRGPPKEIALKYEDALRFWSMMVVVLFSIASAMNLLSM